MKTKTLAISLLLTITTGALFAKSPAENVLQNNKRIDTIPTRDTISKKDSALSLNSHLNANLTAYNFPNRDTMPSPHDTIPKKDSTVSLNNHANANSTAYNFSNFANRDTVPSSHDTIPKKDSTLSLNNHANGNLTAYNFSNFANRDTVPSSHDTIPKKDSTLSLNVHAKFNAFSKFKNPIKKDESAFTAALAIEIYKAI